VPPDATELAEVLRRDYERFSPAQQALARYLVDHLAELPLVSAHEVAQAAHCSPATVVRFAQALGYAGYPELQRTVRQAHRPGLGERVVGSLLEKDTDTLRMPMCGSHVQRRCPCALSTFVQLMVD
jgi:DNA-binding MurR/RpiR family transcriptional regulator